MGLYIKSWLLEPVILKGIVLLFQLVKDVFIFIFFF